MWFRTFLLFLLILFLIRAVVRLLKGISQGSQDRAGGQGASHGTSPVSVKMVRDPVCGTYVVPGKALELSTGRETLYFCSEKCRETYGVK